VGDEHESLLNVVGERHPFDRVEGGRPRGLDEQRDGAEFVDGEEAGDLLTLHGQRRFQFLQIPDRLRLLGVSFERQRQLAQGDGLSHLAAVDGVEELLAHRTVHLALDEIVCRVGADLPGGLVEVALL
jgi:hypothetical protein